MFLRVHKLSPVEALQRFPFLVDLPKGQNSYFGSPPPEREYAIMELNDSFLALHPTVEDYSHTPYGTEDGGVVERQRDWHLFTVARDGRLTPVQSNFRYTFKYPALNTQCHFDSFPPDSFSSGYPVGVALERVGINSIHYAVLLGNSLVIVAIRIEQHAYDLWQRRGCPIGEEGVDWQNAKDHLLAPLGEPIFLDVEEHEWYGLGERPWRR